MKVYQGKLTKVLLRYITGDASQKTPYAILRGKGWSAPFLPNKRQSYQVEADNAEVRLGALRSPLLSPYIDRTAIA